MAVSRTRRQRGESQSLDSLLDTMANVTGILVVLLAVTQISVSDAMGRLRDELVKRPELSQEAFDAAAREAEELREALAPLLPAAAEREALRREQRAELQGLRARIAALDAEVERSQSTPRGEAELTRKIAAAQARAHNLGAAIEKERELAVTVARQIEELPTRAATRDLRLPDPRPAPAGASQLVYFCRYGRIFRVDGADMLKKLWDGVHRATGGTSRERLRGSTIDRTRVVQYFQQTDVGNSALRWHVLESGGELLGQLEWRRSGIGETGKQITSPLSRYRSELLRYSPRSVYFHFFVWDDSFAVYETARALSDKAGFSAGWTPFDAPRPFRQPLTQLAQNTLID